MEGGVLVFLLFMHWHSPFLSSSPISLLPLLYLLLCPFRGWFRGVDPNPHFDSKFHFHGKFWINLLHFGTRFLILLFNKSILPVNVCKIAGWVANSVDLIGRRRVLRRPIWVYTVCSSLPVRIRRTGTVIWLNWTSSEILPGPPGPCLAFQG